MDFSYRNSTYIIDPTRVQNYKDKDGNLVGSELIFYEDNPNPINNLEVSEDLSGKYLDDVVLINFIQQTTDTEKNWNPPDLGFIKWFFDTHERIPLFLMAGFVAWTLLKNWIMTGGL